MQLNPNLSGLSEKSVSSLSPPKKGHMKKVYNTCFFPSLVPWPNAISMPRFDQHQPPFLAGEVGLAALGRQPVQLISIYF